MPPKKVSDPSAADLADADIAANAAGASAGVVAAPAQPAPDPIPDPIVATDDDGVQRPMSGGSFIRLEDGTLTRNPEA